MIDLDHAERQFRHPASASGNNDLALELIAELRALRTAHSYEIKPLPSVEGLSAAEKAALLAEADELMKTVGAVEVADPAATFEPPSEPSAAPLLTGVMPDLTLDNLGDHLARGTKHEKPKKGGKR